MMINKPLCINQSALAPMAQQGLERALAARHLAELSQEQLNAVSGGQTAPADSSEILNPIICGGRPIKPPITYGFASPPKDKDSLTSSS